MRERGVEHRRDVLFVLWEKCFENVSKKTPKQKNRNETNKRKKSN